MYVQHVCLIRQYESVHDIQKAKLVILHVTKPIYNYSMYRFVLTHVFRCLYTESESGRQLEAEEWAELTRKNLIMNVHRNGKWGSLRHLPFTQGTCIVIENVLFKRKSLKE